MRTQAPAHRIPRCLGALLCLLTLCSLARVAAAEERTQLSYSSHEQRALLYPTTDYASIDWLGRIARAGKNVARGFSFENDTFALVVDSPLRAWLPSRLASYEISRSYFVNFASGAETDIVSLLLSNSELRVRLARDLQLRCEVLSLQAMDEPELALNFALQFKFK